MTLSRRPWFFLGVALVFVLMLIPTPGEFRWLNLTMAGLAVFWAVLLGLEELLADRDSRKQDEAATTVDPLEGDGP
jgi:putative exporter of polyketide antibiotics